MVRRGHLRTVFNFLIMASGYIFHYSVYFFGYLIGRWPEWCWVTLVAKRSISELETPLIPLVEDTLDWSFLDLAFTKFYIFILATLFEACHYFELERIFRSIVRKGEDDSVKADTWASIAAPLCESHLATSLSEDDWNWKAICERCK